MKADATEKMLKKLDRSHMKYYGSKRYHSELAKGRSQALIMKAHEEQHHADDEHHHKH